MMESIISGTRNGVSNSNVLQSDSTLKEMGFMEPLHEINQAVVFADSKLGSKGRGSVPHIRPTVQKPIHEISQGVVFADSKLRRKGRSSVAHIRPTVQKPIHEISQKVVSADSKKIKSAVLGSKGRGVVPHIRLDDIENDLSMKTNFSDLKGQLIRRGFSVRRGSKPNHLGDIRRFKLGRIHFSKPNNHGASKEKFDTDADFMKNFNMGDTSLICDTTGNCILENKLAQMPEDKSYNNIVCDIEGNCYI